MKNRSRIRTFTMSLIFAWVFTAGAALCTPTAFVSHVGFIFDNGTVLFHKGEKDDVKPGDIFEVVRDGERIATLEAVIVDSFYARAKVLNLEADLQEADIVRQIREATRGGPFEGGTVAVAVIPYSETPVEKKQEATPAPATPETPETEMPDMPAAPAPQLFPMPEISIEPPAPGEEIEQLDSGRMVHPGEEADSDKEFNIDLTGYRYLKYRQYDASGNYNSFLSRNGLLTYGSTYEQGTQLGVEMKYREKTELSGNFYELPLQERQMDFELKTGKYRMLFGDIATDFRSGSLATVDKKITGAQFQYTSNKLKVDYLVSQSKSEPKSISFYGDNTHGPFSLKAFEILENSERVKLNGKTLQPDEYYLDYYTGQITFCNRNDSTECTEIKSSDEVQVEFEEKLLLSLNGGNVTGMSVQYKVSDNIELGVANVKQEANRSSQRIRDTLTYTITGEQIAEYTGLGLCGVDTICLPKSYQGNFALLVENSERVYKNDEEYSGYSLDDDGYALGEVSLLEMFEASDTFRVEYTYYVEDFVNVVSLDSEDGKIRSYEGGEYRFELPLGRIYVGTERVYFCQGDVEEDCLLGELLTRGKDYEILESVNSINFINTSMAPNDNLNQFVQISYLYVPDTGAGNSDYDHTVSQVFGKVKVGPVAMQVEYGTSESDISNTEIQILREKVVKTTAEATCIDSVVSLPGCEFLLLHTNIVEISENIYVSTSDIPLVRGLDYLIDYENGKLTLRGGYVLAAGAVLFADYKYTPVVEAGSELATGKATRLTAMTTIREFSVTMRVDKSDTEFAPIGGNNTLETGRREITVSGDVTDGLAVSFSRSNFDVAKDVFESSAVEYEQQEVVLDYTMKSGHSVSYSFGNEDAVDNLPLHNKDDTRSFRQLGVGLAGIFTDDLELNFSREDEDFTDNTGEADNTASTISEIGMVYLAGDSVELKMKLGSTQVDTFGLSDSFSTRNDTRNFKIDYYPNDLITVTADIDHQSKTDSRPGSFAGGKDASTININSKPFGRFKMAALTIQNQSYPSFSAGTTNTRTSSLTFAYGLTAALTLKPLVTKSSTSSLITSSDSNRNSMMLDYRPAEKKYATSMTYEWSETESSSAGNPPSGSSQNRMIWDIKYDFTKATNFTYKYDTNESASSGSTNTSTSHSYNVAHQQDEKKKYNLKYINTAREASSGSTAEESYLFESSVLLSEILTWNTQVKNLKFSGSPSTNFNYSGTILETELRADFK